MSKHKVKNATNRSATSQTGVIRPTAAPLSTGPSNMYPTAGFGTFDLKNLVFIDPVTQKQSTLTDDYREALTDAIYEKNMTGVTTFTLQLNDVNRTLLKNLVKQGTEIIINDHGRQIRFSFSQLTKASNQVQLVFESTTVYRLHNQRNSTGNVTTSVSTGVTEFMASLVGALNYSGSPYPHVSFVAPDYATVWSELTGNAQNKIVGVGLGRGTKADPYEDSWTCMSRIASSVGWRLWENDNTVFFGPDEYWLGLLTKNNSGIAVPPVNNLMGTAGKNIPVLKEFGPEVMLIDFDWDVQKPFGQATVTCMMDNWQYDIGEVVQLANLGPANGYWMVFDMQRDAFMPQATMVLQVPMPFATVYDPKSLPLPGIPLTARLK